MPYIFGKPIFFWGGILTAVSLLMTAYFGFNMSKYGLKAHKTSAVITLILAFGHGIAALWMWLS